MIAAFEESAVIQNFQRFRQLQRIYSAEVEGFLLNGCNLFGHVNGTKRGAIGKSSVPKFCNAVRHTDFLQGRTALKGARIDLKEGGRKFFCNPL